jgi:hypothetical protein
MEGFDPKNKSKGLGDTVAKITKFLYIDILADKIAKLFGYKDCGCDRRRKKLNKIVSYKKENVKRRTNTRARSSKNKEQ